MSSSSKRITGLDVVTKRASLEDWREALQNGDRVYMQTEPPTGHFRGYVAAVFLGWSDPDCPVEMARISGDRFAHLRYEPFVGVMTHSGHPSVRQLFPVELVRAEQDNAWEAYRAAADAEDDRVHAEGPGEPSVPPPLVLPADEPMLFALLAVRGDKHMMDWLNEHGESVPSQNPKFLRWIYDKRTRREVTYNRAAGGAELVPGLEWYEGQVDRFQYDPWQLDVPGATFECNARLTASRIFSVLQSPPNSVGGTKMSPYGGGRAL